MTTRGGRWVVALGLVGCSPATEATLPEDGGETGVEDPAETGLEDASSTGADGEASSGSDDAAQDESGDESSTGEVAVCGNGIVEDGEGCDDDTAACRSDCQRPCTLALEVLRDDDAVYAGVALDEDGVAQVAGTELLEEDANSFVVALDDQLEEGERRVLQATEAFEVAREITAHEGGELTIARVRDDVGIGGLTIDVLRYDDAGLLWSLDGGSTVGPTWGYGDAGATALPDGGVAVTSTHLAPEGGRHVWVGRIAADGSLTEVILDAMAGDPPYDRGYELVAGPDGVITVAGTRASAMGGLGVSDPLVVRLDADNDEVWSWSVWTGATNLQLEPTGAAIDGAGRTAFIFDQDHNHIPTHHALIVVFEPDGKVAWTLDTDEIDDDARYGGALAYDASDRLFSFGNALSAAGGYSNRRPRITAFDGEGAILCDEALNEATGTIADAVFTPAGDVVAVGDWVEDFDFHPAAFEIRGFE